MLAVHSERAVEYGLCLPECETELPLSSMGGWKLGLRAGWSGAAARRSRNAITWGGVGELWMRDSRIPASVVAKFWIAACNFRSRFGHARRAQNGNAWRTSYYFPLEKYTGNTTGTGWWKGFGGPPGAPNLGTLWSILAPPFLPVSLRNPAPHVPHPLPDRYRSLRRLRPRSRSPPSSPLRHSLTFHPPPHTFYPPLPTNHRPSLPHPIASLLVRMQPYHLTHASLLYIPPKNISVSRHISRPLREHNSVLASPPPRTPRRHNAPKLRCRRQSTRGNPSCVYLTLYRK